MSKFIKLKIAGEPTVDREIILPDADGTVALAGETVTLATDQTVSGAKTFTSGIFIGSGAGTSGSAVTTPIIVASFAAKGLKANITGLVLLESAPAGYYRAGIDIIFTSASSAE